MRNCAKIYKEKTQDLDDMVIYMVENDINISEKKRKQIMIYTIPDYYKDFHCIAEKCEDTCCAGWQIVIDKKTLKKYKKMSGEFGHLVKKKINWVTGTFRQDKEKRCAFLNECNLCELYLHEGEGGFCKTCRLYPRHMEEFEGVREISLSISCPEAARILLHKKEPVTYLTFEKEGEEEYEEFDPFLFSILEDARKEMIAILQKRSLSLKVRTILILGMAHDMQGRINRQALFECLDVIEKYRGKRAEDYVKEHCAQRRSKEFNGDRSKSGYALAKELFDKLYELELLREEWDKLLLESQVLLYARGKEFYEKQTDAFFHDEDLGDEFSIQLEQLLVYFIFTYFPGAVYDGNVYSKVQMAVYCVWMIQELWLARYIKNGGELSMEERIDLTYRFSREVEHSDTNRNHVEKIMEKNRILL